MHQSVRSRIQNVLLLTGPRERLARGRHQNRIDAEFLDDLRSDLLDIAGQQFDVGIIVRIHCIGHSIYVDGSHDVPRQTTACLIYCMEMFTINFEILCTTLLTIKCAMHSTNSAE